VIERPLTAANSVTLQMSAVQVVGLRNLVHGSYTDNTVLRDCRQAAV